MSDQQEETSRHGLPYSMRTDIVRTTYVGRHREPEVVVDIAEARARRRQRKERDA